VKKHLCYVRIISYNGNCKTEVLKIAGLKGLLCFHPVNHFNLLKSRFRQLLNNEQGVKVCDATKPHSSTAAWLKKN